MSWKTALLREVKGLADDVVYRIAKQFEGKAETTENVAKAARMARRLQQRKAANPPTKPLARAPRAKMPAEKPKPKAQMPAEKPKPKAQMPKPLAVQRPLALPKPGPGLPEGASKPRGGQWWPDYNSDWRESGYVNTSPEAVARRAAETAQLYGDWVPEPEVGFIPEGDFAVEMGKDKHLANWMEKALAKYYKRDFGAPGDPLRDLAVRGLHYDPDMTPERWGETVNSVLQEDPIGALTVPEYNESRYMKGLREDLSVHAPWLAKQPVTDKLYGIAGGGLNLDHFADEMLNALNPAQSGLPNDLAVDISSLSRMSFPQAVERVGRINQWRAKQMEEAAAARLNSPAIHPYKEYPEGGLRWVELRRPEGSSGPSSLSETDHLYNQLQAMPGHNGGPILESDEGLAALQEQLKFEGDSMGHCVGGYCDDVASGRSRIFSLRDAKGMPHVTVEASPGGARGVDYNTMQRFRDQAEEELRAEGGYDDLTDDEFWQLLDGRRDQIKQRWLEEQRANAPMDIVQIKGKQNRAPNPEYLPYVQDFVKSGQWGRVGDLGNTGLVQLGANRYIPRDTYEDILSRAEIGETTRHYLDKLGPKMFDEKQWDPGAWQDEIKPIYDLFEGYKRGGRVKARMPIDLKVNTCGCGGCS